MRRPAGRWQRRGTCPYEVVHSHPACAPTQHRHRYASSLREKVHTAIRALTANSDEQVGHMNESRAAT